MKAATRTGSSEKHSASQGSSQAYGTKSLQANAYLGLQEDDFPKKFVSNFFNEELDRLHLIDPMQETFLLNTLNDGPAPGKHTIGMVRQYKDGQLIVDKNGNPVLKSTEAEHIRTLQKAFNRLLPLINASLRNYGNTELNPVRENGIYDEEFREAVRQMQIGGNYSYREGFIGRETLNYMDQALRRMETDPGDKVEPTPQEEINRQGFKKRVLEAFEIAFNEDVKRHGQAQIEIYEEYVMKEFNPSPSRTGKGKSPMSTVQNVNYQSSLLGDNQVLVGDGNLNIFGESIAVNIEYYRGSSQEANTIGSIDFIGKDLTFKSLAGTFRKIDGYIFLARSSPYDVSIRWGDRLLTIDQKDVERGLGYVSMSKASFQRLMEIHDRVSQAMVRDHFVKKGRESDYWRSRANMAYYDKVQPFYHLHGRGKTAEEVEKMIFQEDFFREYVTAMDRFIELEPKAMGKAQLENFKQVRARYLKSQQSVPIIKD